MISRSLNEPGSDSSALATTYVGFPAASGGWTRLSLRPIGNPAPPRPRSFALEISSMTDSRDMPRAFSSVAYPPTARYSESCVRSRSSAPSSTSCWRSAIAELRHDSRHVLGPGRLAIPVVDDDDRRVAAAARALDRAQRELPVLARLPHRHAHLLLHGHAELWLERLDHLLRADERAREVRADLDEVLADRRQVVHVVEGRDGLNVRRREVERVRDLPERLRRQPPAVLVLGEPKPAHHRRSLVGVGLRRRLDVLAEAHLSTSPITESSDPTIAIRSAINAFVMQVAVASSATNDGARNFTRHGLGPPSETT